MTDITNTAPKFVRLLAGEPRPANTSVALLLGTADRQMFGLEFDSAVVPAVIGALAGLAGKAAPEVADGERAPAQALQTTGMAFGVNEHGQPGIILQLEGGAELAIALTPSDLPALKEMIDEAFEAADSQKH